jgi:hypothetical protein
VAHIRTQIRNRFKTVLDDALPASYVVFASRKYAWNTKTGQTLVDMRFLNDQTRERETMGDERIHVASLYIRVQRALEESQLDDALDEDEIAMVAAIEGENWLDLLEEDPELLQVNFADDAEGGRAIGAIVLRYDVEYRIDKSDPETRIA